VRVRGGITQVGIEFSLSLPASGMAWGRGKVHAWVTVSSSDQATGWGSRRLGRFVNKVQGCFFRRRTGLESILYASALLVK
jgi:hypothetical protein